MSNGGRSEPDPIWMLLALLLMIALGMWFVWHQFRPQMLEVLRYVRFGELWIVHFFTGRGDACLHWLRIAQPDQYKPTPEAVQWANACYGSAYLASLPAGKANYFYGLSGVSMGILAGWMLPYMRWLFIPILMGLGFYGLYHSPRTKFMTQHTLESFIKIQVKMWPIIAPIVKFNPTKYSARAPGQMIPDKLPPFAEALSPEEWISWHRIPVTNGIPDRETTRRAFLLQLGPKWKGLDGQPPYFLALFAAFALMGAQKREEADDLLSRLAPYWSLERGLILPASLTGEIKKIIKNPEWGGQALAIANQFAYRTTSMLGVLKWARSMGGVLAPAQFLWLRAVDRPLWYPLNNLGRRAFHTEGAGAMAHFMAELSAKKPLPLPRIDTAIVTINQFLADPERRTIAIPPREELKSAKP